MSRLRLCGNWEDLTLVANAYKTVGWIKSGDDQVTQILRVILGCGGIAGDAKPLEFRLQRCTAGTGTGTTVTPGRVNETNQTPIRSVFKNNFSAEPTLAANGTLFQSKIHPQGGVVNELIYLDCENGDNAEIAIQVKVPSGETAVTCSGHVVYEE